MTADTEGNSLTHVTESRWQAAQEWERDIWIATERKRARFMKNWIWPVLATVGWKPKYRGTDWNEWWANHFDHYNFLPVQVDNAIELGCGPYTNWRIMGERCQAKHLVLSDPLIRTYAHFHHTYVNHLFRTAACTLDDHPIEQCPYAAGFFDVVVMINVLDHVQNAERCIQTAMGLTRPGGWLIVGQDLSNAEDLKRISQTPGREGHPIAVDGDWMCDQLGSRWESRHHRILTRAQGRSPGFHYGTFIFAGCRRFDETVNGTAPASEPG